MNQRDNRAHLAYLMLLLLILALLPGCAYRYKFVTDEPPSATEVREWRHIAIWGWIAAKPFDLDRACPGGVSEFGSYINVGNWLPAFFTIGLYTPRTVYAICSEPADPGLVSEEGA